MGRILFGLLASAALVSSSSQVAAQPAGTAKDKNQGSFYLQCDGNPNNMSAGEGIARFIGAVTLLALFAPPVEEADAAKRKFGAAGVEACSQLIDGEKAEGNTARRLPLILAPAIHHIEAKDYSAAVLDAQKARAEAEAAGFSGDIYFDRSMGLSIDRIEAAALVRLGDVDAAKSRLFVKAMAYPHSYLVQAYVDDYSPVSDDVSDEEIGWLRNNIKFLHGSSWGLSGQLQFSERYAEAAKQNEAMLKYLGQLGYDVKFSEPMASTAVVQALAGNWDRSNELAAEAKANLDDRRRRGKPETNAARIIEILDLHEILQLAHRGDMKLARLKFAARSQWLIITPGQFLTVNQMLRKDAADSELFGALAILPEAHREKRIKDNFAKILEDDANNRGLFEMIVPYSNVASFERLSKSVWNTQKSKILGKEDPKSPGLFYIEGRDGDWQTQVDSMLLHSALLAKSRGKNGFIYWMEITKPYYSYVRFGNLGEAGMIEEYYLDADKVIAELRQVIPSPEELKLRKQARDRAAK